MAAVPSTGFTASPAGADRGVTRTGSSLGLKQGSQRAAIPSGSTAVESDSNPPTKFRLSSVRFPASLILLIFLNLKATGVPG